jgi:hypothetical protein
MVILSLSMEQHIHYPVSTLSLRFSCLGTSGLCGESVSAKSPVRTRAHDVVSSDYYKRITTRHVRFVDRWITILNIYRVVDGFLFLGRVMG